LGRFEKGRFPKGSINAGDPKVASRTDFVVFSLLHGRKLVEYLQGHLKP
jgi:hypothetical protein